MAEVTITSAYLASLSVEAFLNGVLLMLFCFSTHFMLKRHREKSHNPSRSILTDPLFLASTLMSGMSIAHWALAIYRSIMAFILHEFGTPDRYYSNLQKVSPVAEIAIVVSALATGNLILLYRVWATWEGNSYVMVIPVASFVSTMACGIALVIAERRYRLTEPQTQAEFKIWLQGAFISDIFANVTSSGLIIWKLWRAAATKFLRTPGNRRVFWLMSIFVESSALYVAWNILFTAVYDGGSPVWHAIEDTWVAVSGISFALINVRVGLGYFLKPRSVAIAHRLPDTRRVPFGDAAFAITITREIETDYNDEPMLLPRPCALSDTA